MVSPSWPSKLGRDPAAEGVFLTEPTGVLGGDEDGEYKRGSRPAMLSSDTPFRGCFYGTGSSGAKGKTAFGDRVVRLVLANGETRKPIISLLSSRHSP